MEPTKESIIEGALKLSDEDRAEVVEVLSQSIAQPFFENAEIEAAWDQEIRRRLDEIDEGKVELIPWDQVSDEMRGIVDGPRQ